MEIGQFLTVAGDVHPEFLLPEGSSYLRRGRSVASLVSVPETAVNENRLLATEETDVGRSGDVLSVQTIAVAEAMQHSANNQFRLGVLLADARHHRPSLGRWFGFARRLLRCYAGHGLERLDSPPPSLGQAASGSHSGVEGEGSASEEKYRDRGQEEEKGVFVSGGDGGAGLGVRDESVHEKALIEMHQRSGAHHDDGVHQGAQAGVKSEEQERPADQMAQHDGPSTDGGQRDTHRCVQGGEALHADHQKAVITMKNVVDAQGDAKQGDSVCLIRF